MGVEGKGVHRFRVLDTAIVDYLLTLMMAFLSAYFLHIPLVLSTIVWFIMGVVFHMLFDVKTNTLKMLGITC